jgi:intracellular septation protein
VPSAAIPHESKPENQTKTTYLWSRVRLSCIALNMEMAFPTGSTQPICVSAMTTPPKPVLKAAVEYGPLAVFFTTFFLFDLFVATGALVAATVVAIAIGFAVEKRIAMVPFITGAVVLVFGGLTLYFQDETFIKMKPTIVHGLIAAVLIGGLAVGRPLLKPLFGAAWHLNDLGWTLLTRRFSVFFIVMAVLNELVWRTQPTDIWVTYKVFGSIGLTLAFTLTQLRLINRHQIPADDG